LQLKKVSRELPGGLMEFLDDFNKGENGVSGPNLNSPNFSVERYLNRLILMEKADQLKPDFVAMTTYWLVTPNNYVIGLSKLRHKLTKELLNCGGHISYYIKKSVRGKGIGTELLNKTLQEAKKLGISKVLLTADIDNLASIKVIIKNNGKLADTRHYKDSKKMFNRYWIDLSKIKVKKS
jgi:predicted acetyltransferase